MRVTRSVAAGMCLLTACGSDDPGITDPPPDNHEQIVLENIPYDALGSTRLTFRREEQDKRGIISLNGSSRTASITYAPYGGNSVAASPTSDRLVYGGYVFGDPQRLADIFVRDWGARTGTPLGGPGGMRDWPSWSPDGTRVVYGETSSEFDFHATSIATQTPVPGSSRQMLWSATLGCEFAHSPRQNAAGAVVFVYSLGDPASCFSNDSRLARATPGGPTQIIYGPGNLVRSPTWSPSGAEIAFFQRSAVGGAPTVIIRRMAADGSNVRTITELAHSGNLQWLDFSMCWPGDGSRIFFNVAETQSTSHIYSVVVADGTVTPITTAPAVRDWSLSCS